MAVLAEKLRTCGVTGLQVDAEAERLIKFNAVTAVLYLALGGIMGLLIVLTRWEAVHLLPYDTFYDLVSAHGATMLVFWILFFEMAGLIFAGTVLLNRRLTAPWVSWLAFALMLVGSLGAEYTMLTGQATVMFTMYPPLLAVPLFYASVLLFAVGALIGVFHFLANVIIAKRQGDVQGSLPLFTYAMVAAAVLAVFTLLSGAAVIVPLFLWSMNIIDSVDPAVFRLLYWGFGHGAQQVNLAAMVGIWYGVASLTTGAKVLNEGLSRFAFLLYVLFIQLGSIHHLLVDPGLGFWSRGINTSYFIYAAVIGSMLHAFTIPASVEVAQRAKGYTSSLFDWLKNAPWRNPAFSSVAFSFVVFGVMGGISGVILGTMQANLIAHNTLIVPSHFHMTVVSGTTLAFMGIAYYLVPLIFQRELILGSWARWQPYIFSVGMVIWALGMGYAGHLGVPRRHWDISFLNAPLGIDVFDNGIIDASLALLGIGGIIAIIGGAMFVVVIAGTVFFGRSAAKPRVYPIDAEALAVPVMAGGSGAGQAGTASAGAAHIAPAHAHSHGQLEAPGSMVMVGCWLALFIILYAISWFEVSSVSWFIG